MYRREKPLRYRTTVRLHRIGSPSMAISVDVSDQHAARVQRLVTEVEPLLRDLARTAVSNHRAHPQVVEHVFDGFRHHLEESAWYLEAEGADEWDDGRLLSVAMQRAPRLWNAELLNQYMEVAAWFAPTEPQHAWALEDLLRRCMVASIRDLPRLLLDAPHIFPNALRGFALTLAWTQSGVSCLPLESWRELFRREGFMRDGRGENRPAAVPTLYRAANVGSENRWSWTNNLAFAMYFQRLTEASDIWVLEGASPDAVLARFDSRGEAEWVVDMDAVGATPRRLSSEEIVAGVVVPDIQLAPQRESKGARKKALQKERRRAA